MSVLPVYKPVSWTPLDAVEAYRRKHASASETIAYAGRLDPMAEGLMILLTGDDLKKRDEYQLLSKTYEVDIVWGMSTDTYDIMGLPTTRTPQSPPQDSRVRAEIANMEGEHIQSYPPYSSARVNGKPLFYWARNGMPPDLQIPSKPVTVKTVAISGRRDISIGELLLIQKERLHKVRGQFRQQEIIQAWDHQFRDMQDTQLPVYTAVISSSGGTYMRSLVNEAGDRLGCGAFCLRILRTHVGQYSIESSEQLE